MTKIFKGLIYLVSIVMRGGEQLDKKFDRLDDKLDRLDIKLEHLDKRQDKTELEVASIATSISSINEVSLANNETLEAKLNSSRANQESIKELMSLRFMQLEELIKFNVCDHK